MSENEQESWAIKYRPKHVADMIGNWDILKTLRHFVEQKNFPNLLFEGPCGIGKTTAAEALVNDVFGEGGSRLFLNASLERGIDIVRYNIREYARSYSLTGQRFKVIILDEADQLTYPAQMALKSVIEDYDQNCRYIFCVNSSDKIEEPIISRCDEYFWEPIPPKEIRPYLSGIAKKEGIKPDKTTLKHIARRCKGDLRVALNMLQGIRPDGTIAEQKKTVLLQETEDMVTSAFIDFNQAITLLNFMLNRGSTPISISDRLIESYLEFENLSTFAKVNIASNLNLITTYPKRHNIESFLARLYLSNTNGADEDSDTKPKKQRKAKTRIKDGFGFGEIPVHTDEFDTEVEEVAPTPKVQKPEEAKREKKAEPKFGMNMQTRKSMAKELDKYESE